MAGELAEPAKPAAEEPQPPQQQAASAAATDATAAAPSSAQQKESLGKVEKMKRGLKSAKTLATESSMTVRERSQQLVRSATQVEPRAIPQLASTAAKDRWDRVRSNVPRVPLERLPELPEWKGFELIRQVPYSYCFHLGRFPLVYLMVYIVISTIVIGVAWRDVDIDTDLEVYSQVDGPAGNAHSQYLDAVEHQDITVNSSETDADIERPVYRLYLYYEAREGSILSEGALREIRLLENEMRSWKGWQRMCNSADAAMRFRCDPGESMMNYIWPERTQYMSDEYNYFHLEFTGQSRERLDVSAVVTYLLEGRASPLDLATFLPEDVASAANAESSRYLRSVFSFTVPPDEPWENAYKEIYEKFVRNELFPELKAIVAKHEDLDPPGNFAVPKRTLVYFSGDYISHYEVVWTLVNDCWLALGALALAWIVCILFTQSVVIGTAIVLTVSLVVPVTYVLVAVKEVGLASFLSIFLVIGLGTDSLLYANEVWRHSGSLYGETEQNLPDRIAALFVALILKLIPEGLVGVAFLVQLSSVMRPMREFGLFMSTSMIVSSLLTLLIFVPCLVMNSQRVSPLLRRCAPRLCDTILEPRWFRLPSKKIADALLGVVRQGNARFPGSSFLLVVAFVTLVMFVAALTTTVLSDAQGLPEIFAESHQRSAGRRVSQEFAPTPVAESAPDNQTVVCGPARPSGLGTCGLHWCESAVPVVGELAATVNVSEDNTTTVSCMCTGQQITSQQELFQSRQCSDVNMTAYVTGLSTTSAADIDWKTMWSTYVNEQFGRTIQSWTSEATELPSLVFENWATGDTSVEPMMQLPKGLVQQRTSTGVDGLLLHVDSECNHKTLCYCGVRSCDSLSGFDGAASTAPFEFTVPIETETGEVIVTSEESEDTSTDPLRESDVIVVFGITKGTADFLEGEADWEYDVHFDASSASGQRAMVAMCENFPTGLNVRRARCWILAFRSWLRARGERFPTDRFAVFGDQIKDFLAEQPQWEIDMWFNSAGGVRATRFSFIVEQPIYASTRAILRERDDWRAYTASRNADAATTASGAWPTSQAWADAEAEQESMLSAWIVTSLAVLVTLLAGLLYVRDAGFVLMVIASSLVGSCGVAFFMFCIFQWKVGPWEVLLLTVFLCYSVSPAFRMGREYFQDRTDFTDLQEESSLFEPNPPFVTPSQVMLPPPLPMSTLPPPGVQGELSGEVPPPPPQDTLAIPTLPGLSMSQSPRGSADTYDPHSSYLLVAKSIDAQSLSSSIREGSSKEERIRRSVCLVTESVMAMAIKTVVCGILLLPCEFTLFNRLGAVAVVLPVFMVVCTLMVLPAQLYVLGPVRDTPDLDILFAWLKRKAQEYCFS